MSQKTVEDLVVCDVPKRLKKGMRKVYSPTRDMSSTEQGLAFFRKHRDQIGRVVRVEAVEYQQPRKKRRWTHCPLRLIDAEGNELRIPGVRSGYHGEGSWGTLQILKEVWGDRLGITQIEFLVHTCTAFVLGDYPENG